jgi:aerobic carbon-monoxide dehydrogenase medium subunit
MKPAPFKYHSPQSVAEALELATTLENAKFLAGGQSLMPMMNFRFVQPDHIIDLNLIDGINAIERRGDRLFIGAMARQRDIERSVVVAETCPIIPEAYHLVSHTQIRNRGTFGGSLCHHDPASEQPCFTAALDGIVIAESKRGRREIPMAEFSQGYMTTAIAADELMVGASLSIWPKGHGYAFIEYSRRHGDYAIVGVAVLMTTDANRRINKIAIALCGVAPGPVRLQAAEKLLIGQAADATQFERAAEVARGIEAMEDAHVTADYRQHLAGVLTGRALTAAAARIKN